MSAYVPGVGGGGDLVITDDKLTFEWSPFTRRVFRRKTTSSVLEVGVPVAVVKARFLPPLINSGLILRAEGGNILIATFWGKHRLLVRALKAAGIPTVDVRTNVYFGLKISEGYTWPENF